MVRRVYSEAADGGSFPTLFLFLSGKEGGKTEPIFRTTPKNFYHQRRNKK